MLRYRLLVSDNEKELVQIIQQVQYGEIFSPKIIRGVFDQSIEVSLGCKDLLEIMREHPVSIITVHQGEPVFVEIDETLGGFRCRKKVKLPTA